MQINNDTITIRDYFIDSKAPQCLSDAPKREKIPGAGDVLQTIICDHGYAYN